MMISATSRVATLVAALWFSFASFGIGSTLPNPVLSSLDGPSQNFLASDRVTVFVFFDPEQEHSLDLLRDLAELEKELGVQSIQWTGILSDRFGRDKAKDALKAANFQVSTLVDQGDELYGKLGVRLYPSVGISSSAHTLLAYLPYQKVNYQESIRAHTRHAIGAITQEELAAALQPKAIEMGGNGSVAKRNLRLAKMLLDAGKLEKALAKATEAVTLSPDLVEAHLMLATIHIQLDDCESAKSHLASALELDPNNELAEAALSDCP